MGGTNIPLPRVLGLVSIFAGILGLVYTPFHAAAYLASSAGAESPPLIRWDSAFREALPWAFDFAGSDGVYVTYGRIAPLALLGFVAGLVGLHLIHGRERTRVLRTSFYALLATQSVFLLSTIVEYYTPFLDQAFMVGFPAFLLGLTSYLVFGIASLRAKTLPRNLAWTLIVGAALVIPLIALFGHIPLAMYGLFVAWIRIGSMEVQADTARAPGTQPSAST